MASIKENVSKNGEVVSYRYRCCVGRDMNGVQIFRTMTDTDIPELTPAKLKKEMQARADAWEKKMKEEELARQAGHLVARGEREKFVTFVKSVWLDGYILADNGKHKATTQSFYVAIADDICSAPQFKNKKLSDVRGTDIDAYMNELRNRGLEESTIKHYWDTLRAICNYAVKKRFIEIQNNPMISADTISVKQKAVEHLSEKDFDAFMQAVDTYSPVKWKLMLNIMARIGLRRSEVLGLQWADIDIKERTIAVNRAVTYSGRETHIDTPKTELSVRVLPMPEVLIPMFVAWQEEQKNSFTTILLPSAYVFSSEDDPCEPMFPTAPTRYLNRFIKQHNLPNVSPHDLRHTAASRMAARGVNEVLVSRIMGHSDTRTTDRYYVGIDVDDLRQAVSAMDELPAKETKMA